MTSLFDRVDQDLASASKPRPSFPPLVVELGADREKVREIIERFPAVSDGFVAKRTGLDVEDVAEHVGILREGVEG